MDRLVYRLTAGRHTYVSVLTGLPVVMLTTTGAKTTRQLTVPVVGVEDSETLAVVASNFGQQRHPGWYYNLLADPAATVQTRGKSLHVRARVATPDERSRLWKRGLEMYPGWDNYERWASNRSIAVFVLKPVPSESQASKGG